MTQADQDAMARYPRATILTGFSTAIVTLANFIPNDTIRTLIIGTGPATSLLLTVIAKHGYKWYKLTNTIKVIRGWIEDLEIECNDRNTSRDRKKEIKKEIIVLRQEIRQMQRDKISVEFN